MIKGLVKSMIIIKKNIVICCWKQPKRYLGILFLIARFIEIRFERKIERGGMRLERSVEKT